MLQQAALLVAMSILFAAGSGCDKKKHPGLVSAASHSLFCNFLRIRNLELTNDIDAGLQIASRYNMAHMALGARLLRQELIRGAGDSIQAPFPLGAVGLTTCCTADLPSSTEQ